MKEDRRNFIKKAGVSLAAASIGGIGSAITATGGPAPKKDLNGDDFVDLEKAPVSKKNLSGNALQELAIRSNIRIAVQAPVDANENQMNFYRQMGVAHVILSPDETKAGADYYADRKKYFADDTLQVYGINNISLLNDEKIVLNLPGRDERIEQYKQHLIALGKAGITYTTYAHTANGVWSSANATTRAEAVSRSLDLNGENSGQWGDKKYTGPLSNGREYTAKEIWDNFEYFIKAVAPVAEENHVRIGILPDDPPVPILAGVPRIFSSFDGYKHALELANSPNVGVCLSIGTWAEGGNKLGKDILGMIDYFGQQKKLFKVRVSNIDQPLPHFENTFVDNGYIDIYKVITALKKVNFDGVVIAENIPQMVSNGGGRNANGVYDPSLAWTIGYIKCLRDRVEEESAIQPEIIKKKTK
jgi:mannonate dehydratase